MIKRILIFILLLEPMLALAQYPLWTTNDLASPTGPAFSVPRGTQIRHTFTLTITNSSYIPLPGNSLRYEAVDEYDSEPIISTTVQVINATAAIYRVRWTPSISATYVASLNEYLPGTNGLAAILARNIVTVYAPTTGITVANNHPISVYANGPSNFLGRGGITGGITNGDIVIDGSDIAGTIGGATNVVPGDSFSYDASSRTLMVDTNQLGGSGGGGGDDTAELSNRVTAVEGYTNRAATALQAEADTAQTVFDRGNTVTNEVDFSLSAGVRVPQGDLAPNAPITRADATQLVATVIVSGAVTRLIFESGSVMVTQIANAIEYNTNDYEGASVRTNADLIIVTPYPRRAASGESNVYCSIGSYTYTGGEVDVTFAFDPVYSSIEVVQTGQLTTTNKAGVLPALGAQINGVPWVYRVDMKYDTLSDVHPATVYSVANAYPGSSNFMFMAFTSLSDQNVGYARGMTASKWTFTGSKRGFHMVGGGHQSYAIPFNGDYTFDSYGSIQTNDYVANNAITQMVFFIMNLTNGEHLVASTSNSTLRLWGIK